MTDPSPDDRALVTASLIALERLTRANVPPGAPVLTLRQRSDGRFEARDFRNESAFGGTAASAILALYCLRLPREGA